MVSVNICILFGLVALGFLIPYEVAAADIATESSSGRDEAIENPMIKLVTDNQNNLPNLITIDFDVSSGSYAGFIQDIRDKLKDSDSHGIPVLRPQSATPTWLDIKLTGRSSSTVTMKLEQSNLYFRGYQRGSEIWEFNESNIAGAKKLRFSGSYTASDGLGKTSGVNRRDLRLGRNQLDNAVFDLANLARPDLEQQKAARSLLVLIQMIAEATRFKTISEYISRNYESGAVLDERMVAMQNGWGKISTAVLQLSDRNPTQNTPIPNVPLDNPAQVYTYGQALATIGILIIERPRVGSMIRAANADVGRSLMNLEYVRVNNINGRNPGNLFGTVTVHDGWYTYTFYQRASGSFENVGPGGFATLTNPSHSFAVSGADAFTVNVDLYDRATASRNERIAQGEVVWDRVIESVTWANYDRHLQRVVRGDRGDVTVGYSVLSNALGVTVQVILINGGGTSTTTEVYGTVRASQVLGGSAGLTPIALFERSAREPVRVGRSQPIPLTRTVIAASRSVRLTITAALSDNAVAQGSVDFTVQPGTQRQNINGRLGQVQVVITCA